MNERNLSGVNEGRLRSGRILANGTGSGAAGVGLLLGAGAVYLLEQASNEALATTSRALLTTGVAGLVLMTFVIGLRLLAHRHGPDGRPPGRRTFLVPEAGQPCPIPVRVAGVHERRRSA